MISDMNNPIENCSNGVPKLDDLVKEAMEIYAVIDIELTVDPDDQDEWLTPFHYWDAADKVVDRLVEEEGCDPAYLTWRFSRELEGLNQSREIEGFDRFQEWFNVWDFDSLFRFMVGQIITIRIEQLNPNIIDSSEARDANCEMMRKIRGVYGESDIE